MPAMAPLARQASSPTAGISLRQSKTGNLTGFDKELFKTVTAEALQKKLDQRESLDFLLIVDLTYQCFPKTEAFNANWTAFQVECDYFTDVVCTQHLDREEFYTQFKDTYDLSEVAKNLETSESIHLFIRHGAVQKVVVGVCDTSLKAAFRQLLPANPAEEDA